MNKDTYTKIFNIFKQNDGYAHTRDITGAGIHNIYLNDLLQEGKIERIKRGLYRWAGTITGADTTLVDAPWRSPAAVICLQYALAYYNLTTAKPWEISAAIGKKARVKLPDYPPIRLYYFTSRNFQCRHRKNTNRQT